MASLDFDPTDCPAGWHQYQPARSPPPPGQNPEWDRLEAERLRYERLLAEADEALGYHDARGRGMAATRNAYREGLARITQKQAELLSAT